MKSTFFLLFFSFFCSPVQAQIPHNAVADTDHIMSEGYWQMWNDSLQSAIDQRIEQYRKVSASVELADVRPGTVVKVEQLSHSFVFGGNIFVYGQLPTLAMNRKYEETFGTLFNAATIPFYWKTLEPEQGHPRFTAGSSYIFRRPPTDPIVDFCNAKGIITKGHAIIYGLRLHGHPTWMPESRPVMDSLFRTHIRQLAQRYGNRVRLWDVVNEPIDQANRGMMPDDYTFKCFQWARQEFPANVQLNINDVDMHSPATLHRRYAELTRNLVSRGAHIDHIGIEMHIFDPLESADIAKGKDPYIAPALLEEKLDCLRASDLPIHVSEVTVCAPDTTAHGKLIQAVIARNLYRLWFSYPTVEAITWWNLVDGGGAPGEPSYSGIYDKNMKEKPAYHVLNNLINVEWKTKFKTRLGKERILRFRGFRGKYLLTWKDRRGMVHQKEIEVK
uniref:endo-1,4-beta-xylanase n=1 Tax=Prevotella sp. GTC17260 TaxID=3236796 RepID=A0AB33JDJ7_9BACT